MFHFGIADLTPRLLVAIIDIATQILIFQNLLAELLSLITEWKKTVLYVIRAEGLCYFMFFSGCVLLKQMLHYLLSKD